MSCRLSRRSSPGAQEIVEDRHKLLVEEGPEGAGNNRWGHPRRPAGRRGLGTSLDVVLNFDSDKPWAMSSHP